MVAARRLPLWGPILIAVPWLVSCAPQTDGGDDPGGCDTTIAGVVTAPNGVDPIAGAQVYVPEGTPPALPAEVSCEACGAAGAQRTLAGTLSGPDGAFTLHGVPITEGMTATVPLYVQKGQWRRRLDVQVTPCRRTTLPATAAHLPRSRGEGDLPAMAVAVGDFDAIECVLRHIGIDPGEFTAPTAVGAVHLYENEQLHTGGAPGGVSIGGLLLSPAALRRYKVLLLNCTDVGGIQPYLQDSLVNQNLVGYVQQGGRLYATDWAYNFVAQQREWAPFLCFDDGQACAGQVRPFQGAAVGVPRAFTASGVPGQLRDWLALPSFGLAGGQVPITDLLLKWALMVQAPPDPLHPIITWMHGNTNGADRPLTVSFDYPQPRSCGRVLYSSYHTRGHATPGTPFPDYCPAGGIIAQERVLEYLLFDIQGCPPELG